MHISLRSLSPCAHHQGRLKRLLSGLLSGLFLSLLLMSAPRAVAAEAEAYTPERVLSEAMANNPEFRASLLDILAARLAHDAAKNARVPVLVGAVDAQQSESFMRTGAGIVRNENRLLLGSIGVRYTTEIGTSLEISLSGGAQERRINRDAATTFLVNTGPFYTLQTTLSARQPILRGAGRAANLATIRMAEQSANLASSNASVATSALIRDLLVAYWELWYAERALEVQRASLALTERQEAETRARYEVLGTAARVDALAFATEAAALRESLRAAAAARRNNASQLGALLGYGAELAQSIAPDADPPPIEPPEHAAQLLERALQSSPEFKALEAEIESLRVEVAMKRNEKRARLDAIASAGLSGLYAADDLPGLRLPQGRPAFVITAGLELELPLGPSQANAEHQRALARVYAAEARVEGRKLAIDAEIASLIESIEEAIARGELAEETRAIAEELAEAERARLELGTTTGFDVLRAQQNARETALRGLRAKVDAVIGRLHLEHLVGGLLDRFALEVTEAEGEPS